MTSQETTNNISYIAPLFALIGVITGAALTWVKDWLLQKKSNDRNARYLAVRVVCALDQFAMDCLDVAYDDGLVDGQMDYQNGRSPQVEEPNSVHLPDDVRWESIDVKLTYKALSLPARLAAAKDRVSQVAEFDGGPYDDTMEERQYQFAILGLYVLNTTREFRRLFNVPELDHLDFSPAERLGSIKQQIEESREKHRIRLQELER
ncbi:MAG: hypothetical protein H7829_15615 [Magnetococcus sp. THC-1_WYH]